MNNHKFHYFTSYQTISFITTPLLPSWLSCGIFQDVATCRLHCLSFNNTKRFTSPLPPSTTTSLFSPSVTMVIIEIITSYLVPYRWLTTILAHKSRTMRKILKWYFFSIKMWNQWEQIKYVLFINRNPESALMYLSNMYHFSVLNNEC